MRYPHNAIETRTDSGWLRRFMQIIICLVPSLFLFAFGTNIALSLIDTIVIYVMLALLAIILGAVAANKLQNHCHGIFVFLAALALRLLCLKFWQFEPLSDCKLGFDASLALAESPIGGWHEIMQQNTYYYETWAMHTPYVLYQTLAMKLLGSSVLSIQIFNCFFSALSCYYTYKIAYALYSKRNVALFASLLLAVNPTCLLSSAFIVNQHGSTALMLGSLYHIIFAPRKSQSANIVLGSVFLALAQLMRPEMYVVLLAYICYNIYLLICDFSKKNLLEAVKNTVIFVAVFFAIIAAADFILQATGLTNASITDSKLNYKLMIGLNQETNGKFLDADYPLAGDDQAVNALLASRLSSPLETVMLFFKKWLFQFSSYNYWWLQAYKGGPARQMFIAEGFEPLLQGYMMFILFGAGVSTLKNFYRHKRIFALLNIIFIGYLCCFALMEVQQRYVYLLIPVFTLYAAPSLITIPERIKNIFSKNESEEVNRG